MPTYSYRCTQCGDAFDIVQSFSDNALETCTKCQGKLRKLFNSVGIVFKGSGFYRTDNRTESRDSGESKADSKSAEPAKADAAASASGAATDNKSATTSHGSASSSSQASKSAVPVS